MAKKQVRSEATTGLFGETSRLHVVQAQFQTAQEYSFEDLFAGFTHCRALTYSSSLSIISHVGAMTQDMEVIFGREDILNDMSKFLYYQELLVKELMDILKPTALDDAMRQKIDSGAMRFFVVREMISHEKMFLLENAESSRKRIITGSANFSERAFSGNQNESYIVFDDDDGAWDFFSAKYERVKASSTMHIVKEALATDEFSLENLPVFNASQSPSVLEREAIPPVILVRDAPPQPTIITKIISQKTPRQYMDLNRIVASERGVMRLDRKVALQAVQYIKSSSRTETENPTEYVSIDAPSGTVIVSGKQVSLEPEESAVQRDVQLLLEYFDGFKHFRGNTMRLMRDYFTFMSWFYVSPIICDIRNAALARNEEPFEYPIVGILYGKSNCGKSQLIRTLLVSMFGQEGFLEKDWFTKSAIAGLREQNKRYPMVFDDLDNTRFNSHAIAVIKDDYLALKEYPAIVLSMNADRDTFETEVRKRCLILYTDASLPDHTGESRDLAKQVKRIKRDLSTALYREYLRRVLDALNEEKPQDIVGFSSGILCEIFKEYAQRTGTELPAWCAPTSIQQYSQQKHDKIKMELLELHKYNPDAWSVKGNKIVLRLDNDAHGIRRFARDIPDYLVSSRRGDMIIFYKDYLEEFLEASFGAQGLLQRLFRK
ncbi:MAG: hypothetical protein MUF71_14690 [Candidatus Kapabacteria bacterium]|jgi:hypothetical protein|nr:hypothetical protein [Candidatus Kapabacteria bacterium]